MNIFDIFDWIASNILLLIMAFLSVVFVGFVMKKEDVRDEFTNGGAKRRNAPLFNAVYFLIKWVQDQVKSSGDVKPIGCKAELSCLPKSYMPTADIEVGSASEFDCTYEVFIYKLTVNGTVVFEVNRMTGVLKAWNGSKLVDYSASFSSLL